MDQIIGCAVLSRSKPSQLKMEGRGKKSLLGRLAHGLAKFVMLFLARLRDLWPCSLMVACIGA